MIRRYRRRGWRSVADHLPGAPRASRSTEQHLEPPSADRASTYRSRRRQLWRSLVAGLALLPIGSGCTRQYYRDGADAESYALIDEKVAAACEQPNELLRIDVDSRSRFFDPFDPNRPPMPEDDPRSHLYMHKIDNKKAYPLWHANGDTNTAESPEWWQFLPLDERGVLVLDMDSAVQLALLHSPQYQRQLEQLFLSALDVSSERFAFDTQFFAGRSAFYNYDQRGSTVAISGDVTRVPGSLTPFASGGRLLGIERKFATGAQLVTNVANSIVWDFTGPNAQSASTTLDFAFVQPLLRRAGRDRVLEPLTRAERNLLANIRAFEQYRRSFYLNVTIGRQLDQGVSRAGGVFGVGLSGFTGLGSGFAGVGGGNAGGGANFGGGGGLVPQADGILGRLQDLLQIQNRQENVARLRENLLLLEDTLRELLTTIPTDQEEIPRQRLQVAQARSALLAAESQLVTLQANYQAALDNFLRQTIGLPPYICFEIRDPLLDQFALIGDDLKERRDQVFDIRTTVGEVNTEILELSTETLDPATALPSRRIEWSSRVADLLGRLRKRLTATENVLNSIDQIDLPAVEEDLKHLVDVLPGRMQQSSALAKRFERNKQQICNLLPTPNIDTSLFDTSSAQQLSRDLAQEYTRSNDKVDALRKRLNDALAGIQQLIDEGNAGTVDNEALATRIRDDAILAAQDLLSELGEEVLLLQLVQARARTESVILPEIDLEPREAVEIARVNRRDWANARASLVDAWRLIEFNADDLESSLDVVFTGGNRTFYGDSLGTYNEVLRAGLQWDAPITRIQERNTYRQSLIEYQQAKRAYYQFEDSIWQQLRGSLRQAQANQVNFELQRSAVRIAAEQISLNDDIRQLREARGLSSGPTAARDIIFALNDLLTAQNEFLNIWVNYEVVRRGLDFDLGTMQLTPEGLWVDPGAIRPDTLTPAVNGLPTQSQLGGCPGPCNDGSCGCPAPPSVQETVDAIPPEGDWDVAPVHVEPIPAREVPGQDTDLPEPVDVDSRDSAVPEPSAAERPSAEPPIEGDDA